MRGRIIAAGSVVLGALMSAGPAFAQSTGQEPAGGAAIGEAIGATAGALVATALVVLLITGHRNGRIGVLNTLRHAGRSATPACRPGRRVPSILLGVSLLVAVLGMYWDISLHIDNGRDAGPLANPAHYLILVGPLRRARGRRPLDRARRHRAAHARPRSTSAATGGRPSAA